MKKRVIIYGVNYYPPKGGTSRVAENLILQLKDKYDLTVYCYRNALAAGHIEGVRVIECRQWLKGSAGSFLYFFFSALHMVFRGRADLVHAHKTDCAFFFPLLRLRFKVLATSHEAPYKRDKWNGFQKFYFHLAERLFIRAANHSSAISQPLCAYYEKRYQTRVHFIPNGINRTDPAAYDAAGIGAFLPAGATLDAPYLLFSARRLMATKGAHIMLEALQLVGYRGQVFLTAESGPGPYLARLKALSANLNVFFLGFVEPLDTLLALVNRSELFIFPSEVEGMSIMLLEVASTGRPVIASDIPENTQVFSDREVLFFKSGQAADLARKIQLALSDRDAMRELGIAAQNLVLTTYLWSDIALKYDLLYQKCLE